MQSGIYFGRSPAHACNVHLKVLPETGLVSPQFHVRFNENFDSIKGSHVLGNISFEWQSKARLTPKKRKIC